jgi:hypothetical protein
MEGLLRDKLELHPSMGELVLQHLKERVDLDPMVGRLLDKNCFDVVVAGQAVASALNELFGDGSCVVYNDVDAFVLMRHYNSPSVLGTTRSKFRNVLHTLQHVRIDVVQNEYGHLVSNTQGVYQVLATQRKELLNEVLCCYWPASSQRPFHEQEAVRFLRTFDLNCVQVGVRLSDKSLVWTPAFERFCATRELLVENVRTPVHTAIRWFKKKAELSGLFGHDARAMQLLGLAAESIRAKYDSDKYPLFDYFRKGRKSGIYLAQTQASRLLFSQVYKQRLDGVQEALSRYFRLESLEGMRIALHTLRPSFSLDIELAEILDMPDAFLPLYVRARQGFWRKHVCKKVLDVGQGLNRLLPDQSVRDIFTAQVIQDEGPEEVVQTQAAGFAQLSKVLSEHTRLGGLASVLPYRTLQSTIRAARELASEQGDVVYGLLETNLAGLSRALETSQPPAASLDAQGMRALLEGFVQDITDKADALARQGKFLLGKGFAPFQLDGFRVRELRNLKELVVEGSRLHHCVGGYAYAVADGQCAILALHKPRAQDSLTLELDRLRRTSSRTRVRTRAGEKLLGTYLAIGQLRGLANRSATEQEMASAQRLVRVLNLKHALGWLDVLPMGAYLGLADWLEKRGWGQAFDARIGSYRLNWGMLRYTLGDLRRSWQARKLRMLVTLGLQSAGEPEDFSEIPF